MEDTLSASAVPELEPEESTASPVTKRKRNLSVEARQRISEGQKKRWGTAEVPDVRTLQELAKRLEELEASILTRRRTMVEQEIALEDEHKEAATILLKLQDAVSILGVSLAGGIEPPKRKGVQSLSTPKKRHVSPEGKERIRQATKKRWDAYRKTQELAAGK